MRYKPDGYTSLAPYLVVPDPEAVLRFCEAVFGAERLRVERDAERIVHAECRIDDTVLMMGGAAGGAPTLLHIYVRDAEASFARALAAGAEEIEPMRIRPDGDKRGGVRTSEGTMWYIAEQL